MFQKNDLIIYGSSGVCRIEEIGKPENITVYDKTKQYYKLAPVYSSEVIYTPVDTNVYMRPIISAEEADRLIDMIPTIEVEAYHNTSVSQIIEHYQTAIRTHECSDLIELLISIYNKRQFLEQQKKKCGQVDEKFMKRAEELLYGEFSAALGIPKEEVQQYISARVAGVLGDNNLTETQDLPAWESQQK